ncbi:MAG: hypothetical protein HKN56_04050 [Gammaproteobacteria bacterium]|nr:hypothetical protein [Gammaproteobacteria bacterium]
MYFRTYLLTLIIPLIIPAALVIWIDPYHVWHDNGPAAGRYSENQRYETPGHIRRYVECEDCGGATVLIGTSVSENTTLDDLRDATGNERAVRLIIEGSYPIEHRHVLQRALSSGNVDEVWWEIYRNYSLPEYAEFPGDGSFPTALYNNTLLDDHTYLLNHGVVMHGIRILTGSAELSDDVGTLNRWHEDAIDIARYQWWSEAETVRLISERVDPRLQEWAGTTPDPDHPAPAYDEFIVPFVEQWPDVRFRFYIPPVSLIRHGVGVGDLLAGELALRGRLAELAAQRDNVTLYAFDQYEPLVSDMAYYKDSGHYTASVNRWMLERMVAEDPRFIVTPDNVEAQRQWLWRNAVEHVPYSSCTDAPERCGVFDPQQHSPDD